VSRGQSLWSRTDCQNDSEKRPEKGRNDSASWAESLIRQRREDRLAAKLDTRGTSGIGDIQQAYGLRRYQPFQSASRPYGRMS